MIPLSVLGCGEMGTALAWGFLARGCQIRWLYDPDQDRAAGLAHQLGKESRVAVTEEETLADPDVQAVVIASYDDLHGAQVIRVLQHGKHVFCEKPLATTQEELQEIIQESDARQLQVCSNLLLKKAPAYLRLKEMIDNGELGRIYAIDLEYRYGKKEKLVRGWRRDRPAYSIMLGGGVHMVDLLLWMTGEFPVSVTALGSRRCTQDDGFPHLDYVTAQCLFPSGIIAMVTANGACTIPHQHMVRVYGSQGTFETTCYRTGDLWKQQADGMRKERFPYALLAPKTALLNDFLEKIGKSHLVWGVRRGEAGTIRACLMIDKAVKTGEKVV